VPIRALYGALVELVADIGEPAVVLFGTCARLDRRIAELDRWLLAHPSPDGEIEACLQELLGACAGLWATTVFVARRTPAGIDAGASHLPESCTTQMAARVDALEAALERMSQLDLI